MDSLANLWVAAVGAAASIAAAIVAFYAASRTARLKSQADLALEQLKLHDANRRRAFDLALQESAPIERALSQLWSDIQTVRDVIQTMSSAARFDEAEALKVLRAAVGSIRDGYARYGGVLPPDAARAWHSAKGHVSMLDELVRRRATAATMPAAKADIDARLEGVRSALRDVQGTVQQSMLTARNATMQRILELM
jgi:hypothetical protein